MKPVKCYLKTILILVMIGSLAALFSCATPIALEDSSFEDDEFLFRGNSTLSASVSISTALLAQIDDGSTARLISHSDKRFQPTFLEGISESRTINGATAKLYAVDKNGVETETGLTGAVVDGEVRFENIKSSQVYVIHVEKVGNNGKKIVMETVANIGEGVSSVETQCNEKTKYIKDIVVKKIKEEIKSISFGNELFDTLVSTTLSVINDLLDQGVIDIPSPVIDAEAENDAIDSVYAEGSGYIEQDEKVTEVSETAKDDVIVNSGNISEEEAFEIIKRIFIVITGQEIEDFFMKEFAKKYVDGHHVSLNEIKDAYLRSIAGTQGLHSYFNDNALAIMLNEFETGFIKDIYTQSSSTTSSNVKPIERTVFSESYEPLFTAAEINGSLELNIPQSLILLLKSPLGVHESVPSEINHLVGDSDHFFNHIQFVEEIGFADIDDTQIIISDANFEISSQDDWDEFGNRVGKTHVIQSDVNLHLSENSPEIDRVVLEYPLAAGGTGEVNYTGDEYGHGHYRIDPWGHNGDSSATRVTDFTSGDGRIVVYGENDHVLASKEVSLVIFDLGTVSFKNISHETQEPLPVNEEGFLDFRFEWNRPSGTIPEGYDIKYAVWLSLEARPIDHNTAIGDASAAIDNAETRYSERSGWDWEDQYGKRERIYETWGQQTFTPISGQFMNLLQKGISLKQTDRNVEQNYETVYSLGIEALVIQQSNNKIVARGGYDHVQFTVGEPVNWNLDLSGQVTFQVAPSKLLKQRGLHSNESVQAGTWKVGLFKKSEHSVESGYVDYLYQDGTRSIQPVMVNGSPVVANLGTNADISEGDVVSYTFPRITKADNVLDSKVEYTLVTFYDVDAVLSSDSTDDYNYHVEQWEAYGSDPVANAIDSINYFHLEYVENWGSFHLDPSGVRYHNWNYNSSDLLITDRPQSEQVANMTLGQYFNEQDYEKEFETGTAENEPDSISTTAIAQ